MYINISYFIDPGGCNNDGQVRLVNGTIEQEGRVEICTNRVWGAVCQIGWSIFDAYVLCKSLGYGGQSILPIELHNYCIFGFCFKHRSQYIF